MPKPKHPLRLIRAATPHATQAAFAAFLGVPAAVVQAVECGKGRMTPRLAALIRERTGADDLELLRGTDGAALTLSGRRYTAQAFNAWCDSPRQAEERSRRESLEFAHRAKWRQYLNEALPGRGTDVPSGIELVSVEDLLTPWQSCEFASGPAGTWPRMPASLRQLTGWSPDLGLPARTRLTLAVQVAPVWNPNAPPPGFSATNADLFPPCYFTVATGSGGCRVAAAFWRALCREHAIDSATGRPLREAPTGSWRGFFRSHADRCEPHAVFAGMEREESADLQGPLFSDDGILCGPTGDELADQTLHFLENYPGDTGSPAGILLFASLEGGTASALSSLLLARLRARYPAVPVMVIGVLPLAGISPVVEAPWHIALAMQAIRRHASLAVLFSNDLLLAQASRVWAMPAPGYAGVNLLIGECLGALTAPLRFGGHDAAPVDLATLIDCFPPAIPGAVPVITGQCWPLAALVDRRMKTISLPWLMLRALMTANRAHSPDPRAEAVAAFVRVRLKQGPDWVAGDQPPLVALTGRTGPGLHESASLFGPSPLIRRTLKRLARQAREVWAIENAALACAGMGVTADELRLAIGELADG